MDPGFNLNLIEHAMRGDCTDGQKVLPAHRSPCKGHARNDSARPACALFPPMTRVSVLGLLAGEKGAANGRPASLADGRDAGDQVTLVALISEISAVRLVLADLHRAIAIARSDEGLHALSVLTTENQRLERESLRAAYDVDTANAALEKAVRIAETDGLTGLPSRAVLLDRLEHDIRLARRNGKRLAVLFLDLDDFKPVNDLCGHAVGDLVLRHVATSLTSAVRGSDTVSRHGGDEFLVLLSEVTGREDAEWLSDKIGARLSEPCRAGGHVFSLSASRGLALFPDDGRDAVSLIAHADAEMYAAKRRQKARNAALES